VALAVTTFGTVALMSGFFLKPSAAFDDYVSDRPTCSLYSAASSPFSACPRYCYGLPYFR
jgi:hypothetical protein